MALVSSEKHGFTSYTIEKKGEKKYYVEGYIATYDRDLVDDVISKSAMQDIYEKADQITVDLEHEAFREDENGYGVFNSHSALIPVGKIVEKRIDEVGVWVKAQINHHIQRFSEIWESIQDGFIKAFSIAFGEPRPDDFVLKGDARILTRIRSLLNVALTGNPVNPNATITNVVSKSMDSIFQIQEKNTSLEEENMEEENTETTTPQETPPENVEAETINQPSETAEEATNNVVSEEAVNEIKEQIAEIKALIAKPEEESQQTHTSSDQSAELKGIFDELREIKKSLTKPAYKGRINEEPEQPEESILDYIR